MEKRDVWFETTKKNIDAQYLEIIKSNIAKKYNVLNPQFTIDDLPVNHQDLAAWLQNQIFSYEIWIKYHKTNDLTFDLKDFYADPSDEICHKIINDFLDAINNQCQLPKNKIAYTILVDCTYNEAEIRRELLYLLKTGLSKLSVTKQEIMPDGSILYTLDANQDSLENMLASGYLTLEYDPT